MSVITLNSEQSKQLKFPSYEGVVDYIAYDKGDHILIEYFDVHDGGYQIGSQILPKLKLLNLTQHVATAEQLADGVIEPDELTKKTIRGLLTIHGQPDPVEISMKAQGLTNLVANGGYDGAMVGGKLHLMVNLLHLMNLKGLVCFEADSERVSKDIDNGDGTVTKTTTFQHIGLSRLGVYA